MKAELIPNSWRAIARHFTTYFWLATSSAHRAQSITAESKLSVREASAQDNPSELDREFTTRNPQPMSAFPTASPPVYPATTDIDPLSGRVLKQLTGPRLERPTPVSCRPHHCPLEFSSRPSRPFRRRAAWVASSTRSFFSFTSTSVAPPTRITATPPASFARRS